MYSHDKHISSSSRSRARGGLSCRAHDLDSSQQRTGTQRTSCAVRALRSRTGRSAKDRLAERSIGSRTRSTRRYRGSIAQRSGSSRLPRAIRRPILPAHARSSMSICRVRTAACSARRSTRTRTSPVSWREVHPHCRASGRSARDYRFGDGRRLSARRRQQRAHIAMSTATLLDGCPALYARPSLSRLTISRSRPSVRTSPTRPRALLVGTTVNA